jgi:hypothetical protein
MRKPWWDRAGLFAAGMALLMMAIPSRAGVIPNFTSASGISVKPDGTMIRITWPIAGRRDASLILDMGEGTPLIDSLDGVLRSLDPVLALTVGSRVAPEGRPPTMSIWNTFFDNPAKRPFKTELAALKKKTASAQATGSRVIVSIGEIQAGSFLGELNFTVFPNSPLVLLEAVMSTTEDARAFVFDLGLAGEGSGWQGFAWTDTDGKRRRAAADPSAADEALAVRHRMLACEGAGGSLAIFPPPHQFFFPVDITTNNRFLWRGRGHQGEKRFGLGIRQDATGGGNFVPWFNAPPGTKQRLGLFLLLDTGKADHALDEALRYTRGDRFAELPGMTTYTSHYHMAVAMTAMEQKKRGIDPLPVPEFVEVFRDMNVQSLHLGEFHGDGHAQDPGPLRLPEMQMMFSECSRLSDGRFLLIPGEEANTHLGIPFPGRHPGHWMLLFPKPVTWTMVRAAGQPFAEDIPPFGRVYHVGGRDDMVNLIKQERGLAWTAHARIKASNWTPDIFRNEDFFKDDLWLGAAWKSMPADLSRERLGERCLDLLDDMCNWGDKKYLPGEVDVFKIDHTSELFGHMNINYLRLAKLPRYQDGWQPVLDVLRRGAFFTTTGEVLIKDFTVGGKQSGESAPLPMGGEVPVRVDLAWTFPLQFAEIISGDGDKVFRERIELGDTPAFGSRVLQLHPKLTGRKWVRFEVWDVARNGAYTQPVWITR